MIIRRHWKAVLLALLALGCMAGIIYAILNRPEPVVSPQISKQANFKIYLPEPDQEEYTVFRDSVRYDDKAGVLHLRIGTSGRRVNVAQQATPESFSQVTNGYQKMLETMKQYKEIKTRIGSVTLTHPEELKGATVAVTHTQGTLVFARADEDLTESQWESLFNSLSFNTDD